MYHVLLCVVQNHHQFLADESHLAEATHELSVTGVLAEEAARCHLAGALAGAADKHGELTDGRSCESIGGPRNRTDRESIAREGGGSGMSDS